MSVHVASLVWKHPCDATLKIVLLKLADHAKDDGSDVWPRQKVVAAECGLTDRSVRNQIARAVEAGILIEEDSPGNQRNRYRFDLAVLAGGTTFQAEPRSTRNHVPPGRNHVPAIKKNRPSPVRKNKPSVCKKKPAKPTEEECREEAAAIKLPRSEGSAFFEYFESVGWIVGKKKAPMKDWKMALKTWKRNFVKGGGRLVEPKAEMRPVEAAAPSSGRPETDKPLDEIRKEARRRLGVDAAEGLEGRPQARERAGPFVVRGGAVVEIGDEFDAMTGERVFKTMDELRTAVKGQRLRNIDPGVNL